MSDQIYPPSAEFVAKAKLKKVDYDQMYLASIDNSEEFWMEHGKRIDWMTPY